jgi:hypothetical protein
MRLRSQGEVLQPESRAELIDSVFSVKRGVNFVLRWLATLAIQLVLPKLVLLKPKLRRPFPRRMEFEWFQSWADGAMEEPGFVLEFVEKKLACGSVDDRPTAILERVVLIDSVERVLKSVAFPRGVTFVLKRKRSHRWLAPLAIPLSVVPRASVMLFLIQLVLLL